MHTLKLKVTHFTCPCCQSGGLLKAEKALLYLVFIDAFIDFQLARQYNGAYIDASAKKKCNIDQVDILFSLKVQTFNVGDSLVLHCTYIFKLCNFMA